jgi:hypothetical protein
MHAKDKERKGVRHGSTMFSSGYGRAFKAENGRMRGMPEDGGFVGTSPLV